jgi:hypothetical protein
LDHLAHRLVVDRDDRPRAWALPRDRTEISWPGDGEKTIAWLRYLRTEWSAVLDGFGDADLDKTAPFPWTDEPGRTVADMVAWVNVELTKNTAEIGQLRLLRAARASRSPG